MRGDPRRADSRRRERPGGGGDLTRLTSRDALWTGSQRLTVTSVVVLRPEQNASQGVEPRRTI